MNFNKKYLKYKQKYINLKKEIYGSSNNVCQICPTKEQIIENLNAIIRQVPENCIKYTFIPDELHELFKKINFDNNNVNEEYSQLINNYETYLKNSFFEGMNTPMNTQHRKIITDYNKILTQNYASTTWHQDTEDENRTFYNILYYLKLENCRLDCGTEIAFTNSESEIISIKLPIMEGLIIALKDDCFTHKSPIISLLDHEKIGTRLIIRTYADFQRSNRNTNIELIAKKLNLEKLNLCMKDYITSNDIAIKSDCLLFIKHYYKYVKNDNEIANIFNRYKDNQQYNELFTKLTNKN